MENQKPTVGSYQDPSSAPIVDKRKKKVETPASNIQEGIRTELAHDVDVAQVAVEKSKSYEEILADANIEKSKAQSIVDAMITDGFYEETVKVTKSSSLTLRSRSYGDYKRYLRAIELINPRFMEEQREIMVRYFLAASLVAFKGQEFKHTSTIATPKEVEEAFDVRLEWINVQGERLISLLASKLTVFDQMIQLVMSEGVVENF